VESNSGNESEDEPDDPEVPPETNFDLKKKASRYGQFSANEILLLARAWIQVSTNSITSNNQKDRAFWLRIQQQQNTMAGTANKLNESSTEHIPVPEDRSINLPKGQWKKSLQPALNKFVGIVSANPLTSGQQRDESYYARMREIYAKQSKDTTLPNSFARYMEAYKFLKSSPKFEETFLGSDEDAVGGKAPYSNKKKKQVPPSKVKKGDKPAGRDASKKALQSDILVSKVSNKVHLQLQQFNQPDAAGVVSLDVFKDGLDRANETMSTNADMQVMAMAPDAIKQQYFTDLFASRMSAMANKKAEQELLQLELQNK
jgi:hypothetical protein